MRVSATSVWARGLALSGTLICAAILASCSTTGDSPSATMSGSAAATTTSPAPATTTATNPAPAATGAPEATTATAAAAGPVATTTPPTKRKWSLFGNKDPNRGLVTVQSDDTYSPDLFIASGYCPVVEIRPGTEALTVYEKGHDADPNYVRFQASLGQTARECHGIGAGQISIKVGITGRITAGPKGGPGAVTANLRVVVVKQHDNSVFYTQAFKVGTTVAAPNFDGDFTQVVDNIVLKLGPTDRDLIIYIGFDEGKPKPPPATG